MKDRLLRLWTLPNTLLGLALAKLTGCQDRGVYWRATSTPWLRWHARTGFVALTLGTVIISVASPSYETLLHERRHVQQYLRYGPFFLPIYGALCLLGLLPGRHWYWDHPFEVRARGR